MSAFVGIWATTRYWQESGGFRAEAIQLAIAAEAADVLDGHYPSTGFDGNMHGSLSPDGDLWRPDVVDTQGNGYAVFALSPDGNTLCGTWVPNATNQPAPWFGTKVP